jgi:ribosomal protein S18 acetylase RimI-like enzyme
VSDVDVHRRDRRLDGIRHTVVSIAQRYANLKAVVAATHGNAGLRLRSSRVRSSRRHHTIEQTHLTATRLAHTVAPVQIEALGYRTDIALLQLGGSIVEDHDDYLVVRSPHNPTFWWGNFMLLAHPPASGHAGRWLETFGAEYPDAEHVAIGIDGSEVTIEDAAEFVAAGLEADYSLVMTATEVHPPARPNHDAEYRALTSDDDWAQRVELRMACMDEGHEPEGYRVFAQAQSDTMRRLTEAGSGAWFGAFVDGEIKTSMGLFTASPGLARFQAVETHPDARGRGLAGTLVHHVSRYGFDVLGAHTLVMVADPSYLAIRIYRSVGFAETEAQLQIQKPVVP